MFIFFYIQYLTIFSHRNTASGVGQKAASRVGPYNGDGDLLSPVLSSPTTPTTSPTCSLLRRHLPLNSSLLGIASLSREIRSTVQSVNECMHAAQNGRPVGKFIHGVYV